MSPGDLALSEDDYLLGQIFYSLNEDCQWHREWSRALVRMAIDDTPHNKDIIQGWIAKWYPLALGAAEAFASAFQGNLQPGRVAPLGGAVQVNEHYRDYLGAMNLQVPS
jgi:hypothetical protein